MDEPGFETDFLSASRVAIWGLGLMGGSLALALRGKCAALVGIDADPAVVALAEKRGIVDIAASVEEVMAHPRQVLEGIDLIVLAVPVRAILGLLRELPRLCPDPVTVLDLGSTKAQIVSEMANLPERFDPVGGHPMCGKEKSTLEHAEAAIYHQAPFALVRLERTTARAKALAESLARAVGACPLWLDAAQHDRWVASTSHAPFLVASALAQATSPEAAPLVGPGFRSTVRLAGSSPRMMADILATNTDNIRAALEEIRCHLDAYESLLDEGNFEALAVQFAIGGERYRGLTGA